MKMKNLEETNKEKFNYYNKMNINQLQKLHDCWTSVYEQMPNHTLAKKESDLLMEFIKSKS